MSLSPKLSLLFALCIGLLLPARSMAVKYVYSIVARTGLGYTQLSPPSINNSGQVVFLGIRAGEFGIFANQDQELASTSSVYSSLNRPYLNDLGAIAFRAGLQSGGQGIFTGASAAGNTLMDTNSGFDTLLTAATPFTP